jgi:hypothetical protein
MYLYLYITESTVCDFSQIYLKGTVSLDDFFQVNEKKTFFWGWRWRKRGWNGGREEKVEENKMITNLERGWRWKKRGRNRERKFEDGGREDGNGWREDEEEGLWWRVR